MDGAVRLKLGRREFWSGGGMSGTYAPVSVKVKNIAYAKDVAIHYTPGGGMWKDVPLSFTPPTFGDYDIFGGTVILYSARARRGMQAGGGFTFTTSSLEGEILVNTLASPEAVGVRLYA